MIEVGAITAVSQAITRILRLSRIARLQVSVSRYIKLHAQLTNQQGLERPTERVAHLIDLQVENLVDREKRPLNRQYNWNTFMGALVASMILGIPVYWLVEYRYWWMTTLLVIDALIIVLFMAIGITGIWSNSGSYSSRRLAVGLTDES